MKKEKTFVVYGPKNAEEEILQQAEYGVLEEFWMEKRRLRKRIPAKKGKRIQDYCFSGENLTI